MSLGLAAYRVMTTALEPLAPGLLKRRARKGKEDPGRLGERLGRSSTGRPAGEVVWMHGASVGESMSLLPLVEALSRARPDLHILVTSGTVASALTNVTAQNGNIYNQLKAATDQQSASDTLYKGFLDKIQNTNMAEAATQLSLNQTALQAALQVTATLNQLTLLNYLPNK